MFSTSNSHSKQLEHFNRACFGSDALAVTDSEETLFINLPDDFGEEVLSSLLMEPNERIQALPLNLSLRTKDGQHLKSFRYRSFPNTELKMIQFWVDVATQVELKAEQPMLKAFLKQALDAQLDKDLLNFIVDHIQEGIALVDENGKLVHVNHSFTQITGYSEEELYAMSFPELTHGVDVEKDAVLFAELLSRSRDTYSLDKTYIDKQGKHVPIHLELTGLSPGRADGAVCLGVVTKKTEELVLRERLKEINEEMQQKDAVKQSMLQHVTHELRSPLSGILNLARLIDGEGDRGKVQDYANQIKYTVRSLLAIVDEVLDFTKLEAGKLHLNLSLFPLDNIIDHLQAIYLPQAIAKGLSFSIEVDEEVPQTLFGDQIKIQQVISNLINNAIKFTEEGEVEVDLSTYRASGGEYYLEIRVRDTGIGISSTAQSLIYNSFNQGDLSGSRTYGGTGLGLTIIKQIVDLMDGTIYLKSKVGRGSTFTVSLPIRQPEGVQGSGFSELIDEPSPFSRPSYNVLVVDDNQINHIIVRKFLERIGSTVVSAYSGKEALARARTTYYDIILMDLHMPDMSGLQCSAKIRKLSPPFNQIPIVAVSAALSDSNEAELHVHGIRHYLIKPFDKEQLYGLLERVVG